MREMEEFENHKRSSPDAQPLSLLELYDGKGWRKDISPSGIDQSDYGDCGFLAALGAVAGTAGGQTTIKDMIKPNSDGSCTVTFPGDPGHPVTVDRSEYRNYHLSNSAKWANVVECAYLKYLNDGEFPAEPGYRSDHGVPKYAPGAGAKLGLSLLTGKNVTIDQFAWTDAGSGQVTAGATSMDNVAEDLAKALAKESRSWPTQAMKGRVSSLATSRVRWWVDMATPSSALIAVPTPWSCETPGETPD